MDLTETRTLAWTVGERRFTLASPGDDPGRPARLLVDDGRVLEMTEEEWRAAAQALLRVLGGRSARARPARAGKAWTEEEEGRLAELVAEGLDPKQIAAQMERSRSAVRMRMEAQGLGADPD